MRKTSRIIWAYLFVLAAAVLLTGCVPKTELRDPGIAVPLGAMVYGHVEVVENGKPLTWGMGWTGQQQLRLLILPEGSDEASHYFLPKDGRFYWDLPPGEYKLLGFQLAQGTRIRGDRLWLSFVVPDDDSAAYLGDLRINTTAGRYSAVIEDRSDAAVAAYKEKFPQAPGPHRKALFVSETVPRDYDKVGPICSGWGIDCSKSFHGVEPIDPKVDSAKSDEIATLMPRFRWHPSTDKEVTYDFAIYEAAQFSYNPLHKGHMAARRISYMKGLEEPFVELEKPLKPDNKYFWSVRLRRGDAVSTWSTRSLFQFYLVAWKSGYGHWFSFTTPPESAK